jgi:hypothetical protein
MAIPTKMRRRGAWPGLEGVIRQFSGDPEKRTLGEAINALGLAAKQALIDTEKNASDAVDALAKGSKPAWNPVTTSTNYQAQLWDLVIVKGDCTILFPAPSIANRGAEIAVITAAPYTITVQPMSGLIDGAASSTPLTYRTRIWISSGEGWHRIG